MIDVVGLWVARLVLLIGAFSAFWCDKNDLAIMCTVATIIVFCLRVEEEA